MPANPKYLTTSGWQRFAKVSAAILGSYFVVMYLHMAVAVWIATGIVLISSIYSGFMLWVFFMIIPFWAKNGWKVWLWYLLIIAVCSVSIYFGKLNNPIFIQ